MKPLLNRELLNHLPPKIEVPVLPSQDSAAVLHFGVGGFHRSHQALYFQNLVEEDPGMYGSWQIVGANILPQDQVFVERLRQQDCLYTLKSSSSDGRQQLKMMSVLKHIFYGPQDTGQIIDRIASDKTKLISFTITEGGYMIDEATGTFDVTNPDIQHDLKEKAVPKTVFGYLARGLARRMQEAKGGLTLLSCDNIQENGHVLKKALLAFLEVYDQRVKEYVEQHVVFPNCMVDRITPMVTDSHRDQFETDMGYRDEGLVISEDFCQWIIEEPVGSDFPPLEKVGVHLVPDVKPYEKMKLRVLNGGHSLVGFLGKALGYNYIHESVKDEQISQVLERYIHQEVIPGLDPIEKVDFKKYSSTVKSRFGNPLIKDDNDRIISYSSAKVPKFILPVLKDALKKANPTDISCFIIAAWYHYLKTRVDTGQSKEITDAMKEYWVELFSQSDRISAETFLNTREVFGELGRRPDVILQVKNIITIIERSGMSRAIELVLDSDNKEL